MADILNGFLGVQNYLDDLIVYGNTPVEHDQNLNTVLQKLKKLDCCSVRTNVTSGRSPHASQVIPLLQMAFFLTKNTLRPSWKPLLHLMLLP